METAEHARKEGHWHANWHMRKWRRHVWEQLEEQSSASPTASMETAEQLIQGTPKLADEPITSEAQTIRLRSGKGDGV